jgi:cyclophilin family peptidyl-prolyl cis-trans isomerase
MARTSDPNSATTEFAIQLGDNSRWLGPGGADDYGYGVFAVIVNGWDTIETIMKQPAKKSGGTTMLSDAVVIDEVLVEERDIPLSRR